MSDYQQIQGSTDQFEYLQNVLFDFTNPDQPMQISINSGSKKEWIQHHRGDCEDLTINKLLEDNGHDLNPDSWNCEHEEETKLTLEQQILKSLDYREIMGTINSQKPTSNTDNKNLEEPLALAVKSHRIKKSKVTPKEPTLHSAEKKSIVKKRQTKKSLDHSESDDKKPKEKEKSISMVMKLVGDWRNKYNSGTKLNDAAELLGVPRKTLDDYHGQIKMGTEMEFDFDEHKNDKIGVLRKFNQSNKTSLREAKSRKSQTLNLSEIKNEVLNLEHDNLSSQRNQTSAEEENSQTSEN